MTLENFTFVGGAMTEGETESEKPLREQLINHLNASGLSSDTVKVLNNKAVWVGLDFFAPPNELLWDEEVLQMNLPEEGSSDVTEVTKDSAWQEAKPYVKQVLTMTNKWKAADYTDYGAKVLHKALEESVADHYYLGTTPDFLVYAMAKNAIDMLNLEDDLAKILSDSARVGAKVVYSLKIQPMLGNKVIPGIKAVPAKVSQEHDQTVTVLDSNQYAKSYSSNNPKKFEDFFLVDKEYQGKTKYYGYKDLLVLEGQDILYPIPSMVLETFTLNVLIEQLNTDLGLKIPYKKLP
ncbi:MAG: hypothetical protein R3A45_05800 [Bdellovibrionota bacterium]